MKYIFTSYVSSPEFDQPAIWLKRIKAYTGILERLGNDHSVIGIERINYEGEYEHQGVKYYFINLRTKIIRFPWHMHRLIKHLNPDVVFVNGLIFPMQVIQLRLVLGRSVKIVLLHRAEKPFKGLKRYLQKLADKSVDAYMFISATFANEWKANINVKKIHEVIQASSVFYGIEKTEALRITKVNGASVYLWVGRLDKNKDPLTVVRAFLAFTAYHRSAKLYMIYQSEELITEIREVLKNPKTDGDAIVLKGSVPHDDLLYWYNSADFIISGSHYEGSGVAVCEAMSCGCIPVVTSIASFQKMTGPGNCGILYEAGDKESLLAALMHTISIDIKSEREKTLKQFNDELSFDAIAKKINCIISSLNKPGSA